MSKSNSQLDEQDPLLICFIKQQGGNSLRDFNAEPRSVA